MRVQGRTAHAARGGKLAVGEVIGIKQTQGFGHTRFQIAAVLLKGLRAANVNFPHIKRWLAFGDPMRQRHARAARTRNPHRIIARRHEITAKLGRFAQIITVIGGKAFRPVEKRVNARRFK